MEIYELLFIIPSTLKEGDIAKEKDDTIKAITSAGGEIYHEKIIGHRKLAYQIRQNSSGYYVALEFSAPKKSLKTITEALRLNQNIIRHLIIKVRQKTEEERKKWEEQHKNIKQYFKDARFGKKSAPLPKIKVKPKQDIPIQEPLVPKKSKDEDSEAVIPAKKISKADLDKKLDEILDDENIGL